MNTSNFDAQWNELSKLYHEQRERLLEVEGLLRSLLHLIEIAPDMSDADSQRVWKSEMQQTGARARELLNMQEETVDAK